MEHNARKNESCAQLAHHARLREGRLGAERGTARRNSLHNLLSRQPVTLHLLNLRLSERLGGAVVEELLVVPIVSLQL